MTPEQEVLYALQWNVPRSELSTAAQVEYDRLRPAWGRAEARPTAGEVEAARLAWEKEHSPAYEQRSSPPVAGHGGNALPVNGGQAVDTLFCWAGKTAAGYDAGQVNDLRRRIAAELDAGGPAGPLIENATFRKRKYGWRYDIEAVDWFLDRFLLPPGHSGLGGIAEDPWGDLPVARVAQRTPERYAFELQCDSAWRDFGQLPGTRLWWGWLGKALWELRAAGQHTLASARDSWTSRTFSAGGRSFTWQYAVPSQSPAAAELLARATRDDAGHYAEITRIRAILTDQGIGGIKSIRKLVDKTGTPILYTAGRNYNWRACACILFPDQRWLRFLVRGSALANAVMTAVDQAGNKVARYRIVRKSGRLTSSNLSDSVEIILHPGRTVTDELALVLALSADWLRSYFDRSN